jgi:uncharacterized membrane protein YgcG
VAARLEDDQWGWYYRTALRTVIQACGRVVRAPDDYGATYLADTSLLDLFERARLDMPGWFAEQVDLMNEPDLPAVDTAAATGSSSGPSGGSSRSHSSSTSGSGSASGASGASASGSDEGDDDDSRSGRRRSRRTNSDSNPIADVWDTE